MSQDIIIDNIIMTILFILVLKKKKKSLLIPTTSIQWSPFSYEIPIPHFFFTIFLRHLQLLRERSTAT